MSRRREVPKRVITPDPKYRDKLVAKFINSLMIGGKKSTAEGILYGAFDIIQSRFKEEPIEVFRKAGGSVVFVTNNALRDFKVLVRAVMRVDVALLRPAAFCVAREIRSA